MTNILKDAVIEQLNISYIASEDRLLLKIAISDVAEIALWLTRRIVKLLWQLLNSTELNYRIGSQLKSAQNLQTNSLKSLSSLNQTQHLLPSVANHAALSSLDFSQPYPPRQTLNANKVFLVSDCQIIHDTHRHFLVLICAQHTVKLALDSELLAALVNILQLATQQAHWQLNDLEQNTLGFNTQTNRLH